MKSLFNMYRTIKAIIVSIYCVIFMQSLIFIIFNTKEDIIEINYLIKRPGTLRKIMKEIKKSKKNSTVISMDFVKPRRLPGDFKYILKWNDDLSFSGPVFEDGQRSFLDHNCTFSNCHITSDKSLLLDLRYFDAILFDVESDWDEHPPIRTPHQTYIFTASESAVNYPICNQNFDNYYNLTWTYKLDSNITKSLFLVLDKNESIIGPRKNMSWVNAMLPTPDTVKRKIKDKKRAVVWFSPSCDLAKSMGNHEFVQQINISLAKANYTLDVYGWCGKQFCPRDRVEECLILLKKDYFFYFVYESVFSEDYISPEILYPLLNYAVPIVYGGADYTRFLPPSSFIDAKKMNPKKIASLVIKAIKSPEAYINYFRWHSHYVYKEAPKNNGICDLCKILNNPIHHNSVITNFREWWNPNYKQNCEKI